MQKFIKLLLLVVITISICFSGICQSVSYASDRGTRSLEPITLQLRWLHQFQFAGYYAAVHKGFYRERGLDVNIVAGSPDRSPVNEVLAGRADYGEANSELLYHYLKGEPLVALAAVFQHSASVLLSREDSGINTPHKMYGKKVMMVGGTEDIDFQSMLANEGLSKSDINVIPSSFNIQDLIDGKTDVFNAYLTNEPFYLNQQGVNGYVINPINYGVDFYSDILFTTKEEIKNNPQRVKLFREASLLGWEYAMSHKHEIIDLIITEYSQKKSRAHLEYEANTMEELILPKLVPLGNINPGRFQRMADVMVRFGMAKENYSLDEFIYDPDPKVNRETFVRTVIPIVLLLLVSTVIALILWRLNKRLYIEIGKRQQVEKQLEHMAYNDRLTNIPNRALLLDRLEHDMIQVKRRNIGLAVAYLDLDGFKNVNDNHGHTVGDQLLISVVDEMKKSLRDGDTLARVGGDEFVAVLADLKSIEESFPILNRLINSASLPMQINNLRIQVSVSIGVTYYPQDGEVNVEQLLHQADQAMYKAKNSGKNCYQLYSQSEEIGLSL